MKDDGHFIDDPLMIANCKPDFSGLGLERKRLTDEQKKKLTEAVGNLFSYAVWGFDTEIDDGKELEKDIQETLIEPFIEPLINGEL